MNHLEPLSWPAPPVREGLPAVDREWWTHRHRAALMSLSVRSTFSVIASFLEGCRRSAPAAVLADSVHAAGERGRISFELAAERCGVAGRQRADWVRCLEALETLARSLAAGADLPRWELAHALDTLIGLLLQLEGTVEARSDAQARHGA